MADQILRNIHLQPEVYELVQQEAQRRRNGVRGFSLTLNQIVLEWLDGFNAGLMPLDTRGLKDIPAVKMQGHVPAVKKVIKV
jgi:hypothetical protein